MLSHKQIKKATKLMQKEFSKVAGTSGSRKAVS
jgi:hypothetical protein